MLDALLSLVPAPVDIFGVVAVSVELLVAAVLFGAPSWNRRRALRRLPVALAGTAVAAVAILCACQVFAEYLIYIVPFLALFVVFCVATRFMGGTDARAAVKIATCSYAVQHLASNFDELVRLAFVFLPAGIASSWVFDELVRIAIFVVAYAAFWFLFIRRYDVTQAVVGSDAALAALVTSVLLITVGMSAYAYIMLLDPLAHLVARAVSILTCLMILLVFGELSRNQRLEDEVSFLTRLGELRAEHYEALRDTIETTNIRYHDLKHQLLRLRGSMEKDASLAAIDEMAETIEGYADVAKTGNASLDAVLTQKSFACRRSGIRFTHMVDAHCLDGVSDYDIYSLFGNALDNAIEAVERVEDPERRVVKLTALVEGAFSSIHVTNYYDSLREDGHGGLATTKDDAASHGYGMRSMRAIVEGLDGAMGFSADDGLFDLHLVFPHRAAD